ncbi:MAG: tetratricopeptide repeat protein [Bacillota bacterium]
MGLFDALKKRKSIDEIAEEGNSLCDQERYEEAIEVYKQGLQSLPEPLNAQSEAAWFQAAIGDTYYMMGQYDKAYKHLFEAVSNISGEYATNPFILMRLGESAYELNKDDYKEFLLKAYMLEGEIIFREEPEKYFKAISDIV